MIHALDSKWHFIVYLVLFILDYSVYEFTIGFFFCAVPITIIASFRKMKKLTRDLSFIVAALKESSFLVCSLIGCSLLWWYHGNWNYYMVARVSLESWKGVKVGSIPQYDFNNLQVVSSDGKKVKRHHPFPIAELKDPKVCLLKWLDFSSIFWTCLQKFLNIYVVDPSYALFW